MLLRREPVAGENRWKQHVNSVLELLMMNQTAATVILHLSELDQSN